MRKLELGGCSGSAWHEGGEEKMGEGTHHISDFMYKVYHISYFVRCMIKLAMEK